MTTQAADKQPLDNQPIESQQDDATFDDAFAEFSNKDKGDRDEYHRDDAKDDDQEGGIEAGQAKAEGEPDEAVKDEEQQASTDDLQARLQQLEHSERSQRGRVGALSRQIQERDRIIADLQGRQAAPQPTSKPGESQEVTSQKQAIADEYGSDNWKAFEEDFPDIAKALNSRFDEMSRMEERINARLEEVNGAIQPIQQQAHEQHLAGQFAALEARHADWREVVSAPAFQQWLELQPEWMQKQVESDSADDASALLDIYKGLHAQPGESRNDTREQRNNRLAQAQTVSRRGAPRPSGAPDDFEGAFNHYASKR